MVLLACIARAEGGIDFEGFSRPIIAALGEMGVMLTLSGRNDLCLHDGRKVSGNAQCKRGGRVLHHGTLLYNADLSVLGRLLTPDEEKLATKAIRSTRSRVANLSELLPELGGAQELADRIEDYIIRTMSPTLEPIPENGIIEALKARNASDAWLYPERGISSGITVKRKKRFPSGSVEIELSLVGERISSAKISGDFFGERSVGELEDKLSGTALRDVGDLLESIEVEKYILGVTGKELERLISE